VDRLFADDEGVVAGTEDSGLRVTDNPCFSQSSALGSHQDMRTTLTIIVGHLLRTALFLGAAAVLGMGVLRVR
jgi:hypothetical protein